MIGTSFIEKYKPTRPLESTSSIGNLTDTSVSLFQNRIPAPLPKLHTTTSTTQSTDSDVESLIRQIESSCIDITGGYDNWLRIIFALTDQFGEGAREYAHRISSFNPGYKYDECNKQIEYCLRAGKSGITIRSLFYLAQQHGIMVISESTPFGAGFEDWSAELSIPMPSFLLDTPSQSEPCSPIDTPPNLSIPQSEVLIPLSELHSSNQNSVHSPVQSGVEAFPTEVFPEPVSNFITSASKSIGCPPDFLAIPVLAVLATAIGNSSSIELKKGWVEGPRIYSAVVALPGSKKSPALTAATAPIRELQQDFRNEFIQQESDYQFELSGYNIQVELWKKRKPEEKKPEDQPIPPVEPFLRQIKTNNATMESLAKLLDNNKRGILFEQDELAAWVKSMNAYRGGKGSDLESWLSFWNGSQTIINRVSAKKPTIIDRPLVNVTGCIQPDLLSDLSGIKQNGFFDRILAAFPDPIPQHYSTVELPDEITAAYNSIVKSLFSLQPSLESDGTETPFLMTFTEPARIEWEQWNLLHDSEMNSHDLPYYLLGVWSKLQGYMARFILILQLTSNAYNNVIGKEIEPDSIKAASNLISYFKSHTRKIYRELYNSEMDRRIVLAVSWITRQGGKVTSRMILTNNVGKCASAQQVNELLVEMVERAIGTVAKTIPEGGGRPSLIFTLNRPANTIKTS